MIKQISLTLLTFTLILSCGGNKDESTETHTMTKVESLNKVNLTYPDSKPDTTKVDTYFDAKIVDSYQWLEDDKSEETANWVDAQNKLTRDYLDQIPYLNDLKKRTKEVLNYAKAGIPYERGGYIFYSKNDGLQNQSVTYYKKGENGEEKEFLNPNTMSDNGTVAAHVGSFSKDKKYAAIFINEAGSDWASIRIKNIETNQFESDKVEKVKFSGASWYKDGFFYSRFPVTEGSDLSDKNEFHSVYYHKFGTSQSKDILIVKDTDPLTYNYITVSDDESVFMLSRAQGTYGDKLMVTQSTADFKNLNWVKVIDDYTSENSVVDVHNGAIYLLTDRNASNKKLVAFTLDKYKENQWEEIVPNGDALIESVSSVGGKLFLHYLEKASTKIYSIDYKGENKTEIKLPGIGTVGGFNGEEEDASTYYYYTSFNVPITIYKFDLATQKSEKYWEPKLAFNPTDFETKQVWYDSKDRTKVSMFIIHKKGVELNGDNPTYLYGYGGFNINIVPSFKSTFIPFLEQGGVYAVANLRGGGEYGAEWHEAGMLMKKQNVFDDFITAAEYLIAEKYTRKEKLAISGRSNGGLLVGACMTQRPDLFQVAYPGVGVLDMLKYHKFTIGWGWVPEYGSSEQSKEMFDYLKAYSPLHNVKEETTYPATMVATADHDDRVVPAHSFKFIAEVQAKHKGDAPVLIRIEKDAGHGAGKPTSKIIDEIADQWAFLFFNMGYEKLPNK